jgi:hypothetical protein
LAGNRELQLTFSKPTPERLEIVIRDNGIGRKKSAEINQRATFEHHANFATRAITNRLQLLSIQHRMDFRFEILDLTDDKGQATGTEVRIHFPFLTEKPLG